MIGAVALAAAIFSAGEPPPSTRATPPALEVSLDLNRCASLPREQVFRLVALELDARVVTPDRAGQPTTRVEVACAGNEVELRVSDHLTGKLLTRAMALAAREAHVSARLVAIAVAELVLTSWLELTLPRTSAGPASGNAPPSPELRRAAQERAERHLPRQGGSSYVSAVGQALGPFEGVGFAPGGGLRLGWTPGALPVEDTALVRRPTFDFELGAVRNETRRPLGTVDVTIWSAALRLSLRLARGRSWLDAGAGVRAGVARIEGSPRDPVTTRGTTLAGTWAGPTVYLGVGRQFSRVVVSAGIEGGTVVRSVSGVVDEGASISVAGRWLCGTLAVGWAR